MKSSTLDFKRFIVVFVILHHTPASLHQCTQIPILKLTVFYIF